jgi:hypothetical protein
VSACICICPRPSTYHIACVWAGRVMYLLVSPQAWMYLHTMAVSACVCICLRPSTYQHAFGLVMSCIFLCLRKRGCISIQWLCLHVYASAQDLAHISMRLGWSCHVSACVSASIKCCGCICIQWLVFAYTELSIYLHSPGESHPTSTFTR